MSTVETFDLVVLKAVEVWGLRTFVTPRDTEDAGLAMERIPVVDDETFAGTVREAAVLLRFAEIRNVLKSGFGAGTPAPVHKFPALLLDAKAEVVDLAELVETRLWWWGRTEAVVAADDGATLLAGRTGALVPNSAWED